MSSPSSEQKKMGGPYERRVNGILEVFFYSFTWSDRSTSKP